MAAGLRYHFPIIFLPVTRVKDRIGALIVNGIGYFDDGILDVAPKSRLVPWTALCEQLVACIVLELRQILNLDSRIHYAHFQKFDCRAQEYGWLLVLMHTLEGIAKISTPPLKRRKACILCIFNKIPLFTSTS